MVKSRLFLFAVTAALLLGVAAIARLFHPVFEFLHAINEPLLLILTTLASLLALRFNRSNWVLIFTLFLFWFYLPRVVNAHLLPTSSYAVMLWVLFGALLLSSYLKEKGLFNRAGLIKMGALLVTSALLYLIATQQPHLFTTLLNWSFLPQNALVKYFYSDLTFAIIALTLILGMHTLLGHKPATTQAYLFAIVLTIAVLFVPQLKVLRPFLAHLVVLLFISALLYDSYIMAYIDPLTSLPGRRALMDQILKMGPRYALAMADIDHFKKFNDTYGHDTGDEVLQAVAKTLATVQGGGKAFRYGGEEFTILFNNKSAKEAKLFLDDVRTRLAEKPFNIRNHATRPKEKPKNRKSAAASQTVQITVSMGVADNSSTSESEAIMKAADNALYKAKKAGRNCVVI